MLTGCRKGAVRRALDRDGIDGARRALAELVHHVGRDNVAVELTYALDPLADERYDALAMLAEEFRLPLVATTAAHYHGPPRRPLATALAAVRARSSLDEVDGWLPAWSEQHLRSGEEMAARFARWPEAVENAARLGKEIAFPLQLIAPDLPPFPCPDGLDEMAYLRKLTYDGASRRYAGKPHADKAYEMIEHELEIIEELHFPGYFLVVWDIARFCRSKGILCQGRGSAANSAVCYALEITAVDAVYYGLMFERFLAPERGEPPDIDMDIESDRREEAIQYVYELHGREHAAQVANVISYRPKSAVRDVAKALGYSQGQQDAWSKEIEQGYYWSYTTDNGTLPPVTQTTEDELAEVPRPVVELAAELQNAPRHLGIHSGGMVMCDRPVIEVCPVEWGRMPNRSVLQWDKDDCAQIGLVKFDLLGLGMLSAIQYCFELITSHHGVTYELATIPQEQSCVYDMLCAADSVGVFQVESRAQMATLPRLRPRTFYDLACEVALIRPGPIQGDSVHPFIRRKNGEEPITYAHPRLEEPLKRTLGIPLFQEQLMQIAVAVADFSPAEADSLRRAMGSKRSKDKIESMRVRLYEGMAGNGIVGEQADADRREDQGLRRVRLRRVALHLVRAARLRLVLAQAALPGGVLRRAAQRPADGLLLAAVLGARRQAARRRGAQTVAGALAHRGVARGPGQRRVPVRVPARTPTGGPARAVVGAHHRQGRRRRHRRRPRGRWAVHVDVRPRPAGRADRRPGRGARHRRRVRPARALAAGGAVGRRRGGDRPAGAARHHRRGRDGTGGRARDDRAGAAHRRHVGHPRDPRRLPHRADPAPAGCARAS